MGITRPLEFEGMQDIMFGMLPKAVSQFFLSRGITDDTLKKFGIWWNGKEWESLIDDRFYSDLAGKRLVYCSPKRNEDAGGSFLRVLKFYQRGYRIPLDSMGAVIARLVGGVRMDQVNGEEQLAKVLTGLLREVDPNVDPTHEAHLPSMKEDDDK